MLGRRHTIRGSAEDVESYARARWVDAVRTLVALGATVPEAELAARTAWVRTWRPWKQERRSGDVDVLVFGELLRAWGWPKEKPDIGADRVARLLVVEARLSDYAAERITGGNPHGASLATWGSHDDEEAYRGAAPIAEIHDDLRRRRRRTTVLVAVVVAGAAAIAGLVLVLGDDPDQPARPDRLPVVANRLPLAWWSQDTLHLGRSELTVPGLVELAQAGLGPSYAVVFGDERGQVLQVDDALDPVRIGSTGDTGAGSLISASPDGRAAWVDVSYPIPTVVVWDTAERAVVDRLSLIDVPTGLRTQVVALDGDTVYLRSPAGTSRWVLGEPAAQLIPDRVVDVANGVLLVAVPPADTGTSVLSGPGSFRVGADHQATLSPGGLIAATWLPGEPDLTLTGSGANLTTVPLQLPQRSGILEARFAPDGGLVLVLTNDPAGSAEGPAPVTVATCVLQTGTCEEIFEFPDPPDPTVSGSPLILAH